MKKKKKEIRRTWKYIQISSYLLLRVEFKNERQHGSRLLQNNCSAHVRTDERKRPKLARLCIHDSAEEEVVHSWPSSRLTSRINSWSYTCTYTRTLISLPSKKRVPQNHAPPSS